MSDHKHDFYMTIYETVECFDKDCKFKISLERLFELLEIGLNASQASQSRTENSPITDEELDMIQWRAGRGCHYEGTIIWTSKHGIEVIEKDVPVLIAEVRRLNREVADLNKQLVELIEKNDRMESHLEAISAWGDAYPLVVFPEPDFKKVRELLEAGGITLDAVSASNMRHVVEGVAKIAREGLGEDPQSPTSGG